MIKNFHVSFMQLSGTYVGILSYIKKTSSQEHLNNNIWEKERLILPFLKVLHLLITKFLFIFHLCSRTPRPPHPHPPKEKKQQRKTASQHFLFNDIIMLSEQATASFFFFCSMLHTLLRSINTMLFIKLTDVKNCTCDVKIDTSFKMHLPQGIYNILCFAKVYIIQSISHLVFHFLKKEKEKNTTE